MQKIRTTAELKAAIRELEDQHYINEQLMRRRIRDVAEDLRPVNLLKNTARQLFRIPESRTGLKNSLLRIATGLATSYLLKKFFRKR